MEIDPPPCPASETCPFHSKVEIILENLMTAMDRQQRLLEDFLVVKERTVASRADIEKIEARLRVVEIKVDSIFTSTVVVAGLLTICIGALAIYFH